MDSFITFGTLFEHNSKQYIYLARTEEIIYAGQILDEDNSQKLQRLCDKSIKRNKNISLPLFCFVILSTQEFKNRAAFLGGPGYNDFDLSISPLSFQLNFRDLEEIKREILDNRAIPLRLKELVRDIEITKNGK